VFPDNVMELEEVAEAGEQGPESETPLTEQELDVLLKADTDDAMEDEDDIEVEDDDTYDPDWSVAAEVVEEEEAAEEAELMDSGIQLRDDYMGGETTEEELSFDWGFESDTSVEFMPIASRTRSMSRDRFD